MFTGIVEYTHRISASKKEGSNIHFYLETPILKELKVDQSIAHNGVCLTITEIDDKGYWVTAVDETLQKTSLSQWKVGDRINIERSLKVGDRLDGHMVQGHVDSLGRCTNVQEIDGSWLFDFDYPREHSNLLVDKGSICINGVSLTVIKAHRDKFSVTIIPYTYEFTNFSDLKAGDKVNLEFDILGKYIHRMIEQQIGQFRSNKS
jgi:riboflavin synthase